MPIKIDLTGETFGKWKVIQPAKNRKTRTFWLCKCECGTVKEVAAESLRRGQSKTCGCSSFEYRKHEVSPSFKDLTGKTFGRLKVLKRVENNKGGRTVFLCKCECGNDFEVTGKRLLGGITKSCGCLRREKTRENSTSHGMSNQPIYKVWLGMRQRCNNPTNKGYKDYGGRGIIVCEEWNEKFESFHEWAFKNGYKKGLTIERKDVNGNYNPENCCWIPASEQSRNRRTVIIIEYKNEKKTMAEWALYFGVSHSSIQNHIKKGNVEKAFDKWSKNNAEAKVKELKAKGEEAFIDSVKL